MTIIETPKNPQHYYVLLKLTLRPVHTVVFIYAKVEVLKSVKIANIELIRLFPSSPNLEFIFK